MGCVLAAPSGLGCLTLSARHQAARRQAGVHGPGQNLGVTVATLARAWPAWDRPSVPAQGAQHHIRWRARAAAARPPGPGLSSQECPGAHFLHGRVVHRSRAAPGPGPSCAPGGNGVSLAQLQFQQPVQRGLQALQGELSSADSSASSPRPPCTMAAAHKSSLPAKMPAQAGLGNAHRGGHLIDGHGLEALDAQQAAGGLDDGLLAPWIASAP